MKKRKRNNSINEKAAKTLLHLLENKSDLNVHKADTAKSEEQNDTDRNVKHKRPKRQIPHPFTPRNNPKILIPCEFRVHDEKPRLGKFENVE